MFEGDFLARESILTEGHSLITNKLLSESFGFKSFTMFIYSQRKFSQTQRMKFHYALNGRGKSTGVLSRLNGVKVSDSTAIIPLENSEEFKEFLEFWGNHFRNFEIMIPEKTIEFKEFLLDEDQKQD